MYRRYECCEICVFSFPKEPVLSVVGCKLRNAPVLRHEVCPAFIPRRKYRGETKPYEKKTMS